MIINKVTIKDFFRYHGEQTIDCDSKGDKNVVVLIGENGRGKTTLLKAFSWGLYGEKKLVTGNMLNDNKARGLKELEETEAFVAIEFTEKGVKYILRRSQKFIKSKLGDVNKVGTDKSICMRIRKNGDQEEVVGIDNFINSIIPKNLSGFFFFDGERIDRLAKIDGRKEIKQAILDILGIDTIETAERDLKRVKNILMEEMKKYSVSQEAKEYAQKHTEYDVTLKKRYIQRENLIKDIDNNEKIIEDCTRKLKESNIHEVKVLETERKSKLVLKEKSERELVDFETKIKRFISENFKYHLLAKHNDYVKNLLEERRAKGQLPSDIKYTFVEDLLEAQKCICGCVLSKGTTQYENVNALKENSGRPEFDDAYTRIIGLIDDATNNNGKDFFKKLNSLKKQREKLKNTIIIIKNDLVDIKKKLDNIKEDDVSAIEKQRENARLENNQNNQKFGQLRQNIDMIEKTIKKLEIKINEVNSKSGAALGIDKKVRKLEKLINLNLEFKELFTKIVREDLDSKIKDVFSKITSKSYRVPILNENFELKITSTLNNSKKEVELSTGEGQITSLSFIGALVSYAKENQNSEVLSSLCGNEYPIVMDSPFGNLDKIHTENVASNIGYLASQVIIIVSEKQWKGNVEDNIKHQVASKYGMRDGEIDTVTGGEYTRIVKEV